MVNAHQKVDILRARLHCIKRDLHKDPLNHICKRLKVSLEESALNCLTLLLIFEGCRVRSNGLGWETNFHRKMVELRFREMGYMVNFYEKLLGKQEVQRAKIPKEVFDFGGKLTIQQQFELSRDISSVETKNAMFNISDNKSLGPYGFTSGFFK
ncbi:hypothetical protein Cgig2_017994 [Carnegiea gigantea]|uniref:Uncharacterized protein n=1 Tax=Carnegiea gigantea TaxID=171969 RepID=A0A9Q1JQW9_9CARY|nr:hypothetical protein Cgig2_017994 [Carnegiea gigantea]